jgi:hypothetical protein
MRCSTTKNTARIPSKFGYVWASIEIRNRAKEVAELVQICKEEDKLLKTLNDLDNKNRLKEKPASQERLRNLFFGGGECNGFIQKVVERSVNLLVRESKGMIEKSMMMNTTIDVERLKRWTQLKSGFRQSNSVQPKPRVGQMRELEKGIFKGRELKICGVLPERKKEKVGLNVNTLPYRFMSPSV